MFKVVWILLGFFFRFFFYIKFISLFHLKKTQIFNKSFILAPLRAKVV